MSRKYAMTKITKGDYIVPSNDGTVLFRITQYDDLDNDKPVKWWGVHVFDTPVERMNEALDDDFLEWERWREISCCHASRQVALDEALANTPERYIWLLP